MNSHLSDPRQESLTSKRTYLFTHIFSRPYRRYHRRRSRLQVPTQALRSWEVSREYPDGEYHTDIDCQRCSPYWIIQELSPL